LETDLGNRIEIDNAQRLTNYCLNYWIIFSRGEGMFRSFKRGVVAASVALLTGLGCSAANATVFIEVDGSGSLASGATSANLGTTTVGNFTISSVNGTAFPAPDYLSSNTIGGSTSTGGTLTIDVTVTGLTQSALQLFSSSFGSNVLNGGLTLTEQTFLDTANGIFTTTGPTVTQLGSQGFTGGGFQTQVANLGTVPAPFSITEVYTITGTSAGNFNANIDVSAVPEPSTWAMLMLGFLGVGFTAYRRKLSFRFS
jgi:hypothetical protein